MGLDAPGGHFNWPGGGCGPTYPFSHTARLAQAGPLLAWTPEASPSPAVSGPAQAVWHNPKFLWSLSPGVGGRRVPLTRRHPHPAARVAHVSRRAGGCGALAPQTNEPGHESTSQVAALGQAPSTSSPGGPRSPFQEGLRAGRFKYCPRQPPGLRGDQLPSRVHSAQGGIAGHRSHPRRVEGDCPCPPGRHGERPPRGRAEDGRTAVGLAAGAKASGALAGGRARPGPQEVTIITK